MIMTDMRLF